LQLNIILQLPGENFLIIGALDECPIGDDGRDELCEHLRYISSFKNVHLLATSRREIDLEDGLVGSEGLFTMPIRNAQVDADIDLYVQSQLETKFKSMRWLPKVKDVILEGLREKAQGS